MASFSSRLMSSLPKSMAGLTLGEVEVALNWWLKPSVNAESWDNVGLLVGSGKFSKNDKIIDRILLCNDLTMEVIEEAISLCSEMIIAYHPPLFKPIKTLNYDDWKQEIVMKCLAHGITVYSPHTALDSVFGGINDALANIFGTIKNCITPVHFETFALVESPRNVPLENYVTLELEGDFSHISEYCREMQLAVEMAPHSYHQFDVSRAKSGTYVIREHFANDKPDPEGLFKDRIWSQIQRSGITNKDSRIPFLPGAGRRVVLEPSVPLDKIVEAFKTQLKLANVQVAIATGGDPNPSVNSIGICAGSGGSMFESLGDEIHLNLVITGEMSHHQVHDQVQRGRSVILLGHCNSERHYLPTLKSIVSLLVSGYRAESPTIVISTADKAPLQVV